MLAFRQLSPTTTFLIRDSGKPNLTAIVILADIVYWYKPVEVRDEVTGQVVESRKKFKADLLQRSYQADQRTVRNIEGGF